MTYIRNGREVSARPWQSRLDRLAASLVARWFMAHTRAERKRLERMRMRAYALTPSNFSYHSTRAERNWKRYCESEAAHG